MPQRIPALLARSVRRHLHPRRALQPSISSSTLLSHYHQHKPLSQTSSIVTSTPSRLALALNLRPHNSLSLTLNRLPKRTRLTTKPTTTITTTRPFSSTPPTPYASPTTADALVETLTDLYATARDEFEIAAEETEKKTVYAADDRAAAREAFEELKQTLEESVSQSEPEVGRQVQTRVGQRVRELERALVGLEESALHDD